jgi:hypothetical protein
MVPIKPVEMMTALLIEEIKNATWKERYAATKFILFEVPRDIIIELTYWAKEKLTGPDLPDLPEHWVDASNNIIHTTKINPSELGNKSQYH